MDKTYIYIAIPEKYKIVYETMMIASLEVGEATLKECNCDCHNKNNCLRECYDLFNSVVAAYNLNQEKLADTIIKYIIAKLKEAKIYVDENLVLPEDIGVDIITIMYNNGTTDQELTLVKHDIYYEHKIDISLTNYIQFTTPADVVIESCILTTNSLDTEIMSHFTIKDNIYTCSAKYLFKNSTLTIKAKRKV
jgi:hypothetical protein